MIPSDPLEKIFRSALKLLVISAGGALSLFLSASIFVRLLGDDYCISARLIANDPLQSALIKYLTVSNRFSNQIVAWFSDLFGLRGGAVLSVVTILIWCAGLLWLMREIAHSLRIHWDAWTAILAMEVITVFAFYTAPNLYQSVYWRPGVMTYFLPLALFLFVFAAILRMARISAPRGALPSRLIPILLFLSAFIIGGLSETAGMFHLSLLGLGWLANWKWNQGETRRPLFILTLSTFCGSLVAMLAMLLTPANSLRLDVANSPTPLIVIGRAFTYAVQFLFGSAAAYPLPLALAFAVALLFVFLGIRVGYFASPVSHPRAWLGLLIVPALAYLITAATFAPSAYGQSFPIERVRFPAHILMIIMLIVEGGLLGWLAAHWPLPRWSAALAMIPFALVIFYPLWIARNSVSMVQEMAGRAQQWESRNDLILQQIAKGERDIAVPELAAYANIKELDAKPNHWINRCAAYYYGVNTIRAMDGELPSP